MGSTQDYSKNVSEEIQGRLMKFQKNFRLGFRGRLTFDKQFKRFHVRRLEGEHFRVFQWVSQGRFKGSLFCFS